MDFEIKYIETTKTARYLTYGQLTERTRYYWFVLHGTKMVSEQMIKKFRDFDPELHFIVAPEGLSRFYVKGFGGEVVATWMTSRDRLEEIKDFSVYLTELYKSYATKLSPECKKIVLGFSQGGTTAYRWLHHSPVELDLMLAYSCWIPEDIDLRQSATDMERLFHIYTYGLQDQFLSKERIHELSRVIDRNNLKLVMEPYEGVHKIDRVQLRSLFDTYISK